MITPPHPPPPPHPTTPCRPPHPPPPLKSIKCKMAISSSSVFVQNSENYQSRAIKDEAIKEIKVDLEGENEVIWSGSSDPAQEKGRRQELVGGRSHLPRVVFLPFIWTGIGIQFQLSILHLLKHTDTHTCTRAHIRTHGQVERAKDAETLRNRNTPEAL